MKTRLTVELVPRTSWFNNVRSAVSPEIWDRLKKETARQAGSRCEICGGRGPKWPVEAHEVWEYNDQTKVQRLVRLQALCPDCHSCKHIGYTSSVRGKGASAIRHLAKVNGWSVQDVEMYLEVAFEQWMRRSSHEWTLDLVWLYAQGVKPEEIRASTEDSRKSDG